MNLIRTKSILAALVAAVLMGCLGFLVRKTGTDAAVVAFFRFSIGFVLMSCVVLYYWRKKQEKVGFSPSSFFSGISIGLCILFYFFALQNTSIGLAAFVMYLGPVFAIIGEAVMRRRLPGVREWLIIVLAFSGFVMISSLGDAEGLNKGTLYALLSGIFYGGYILINRFIPGQITLPVRVFWQFLAAVVAIGLVLLCTGCSFAGVATGWPYVLTIGVVQGFAVLLLTGYAIKHLSAIEFGALSYAEPLVALLLGIVLYDESMTSIQIVGIMLIVAGMVVQCLPEKSEKKQNNRYEKKH